VRVVVQRHDTPIRSFFGRVLGFDSYQNAAAAVAYVGFVGKLLPNEVDWPIAVCYENVNDGCNVGRFIPDPGDTGGWTNLEQPGGGTAACSGSASNSSVNDLVHSCGGGINADDLILGWDVQTNNGQLEVFAPTFDCWSKNTVRLGPDRFDGRLQELDTDGDGHPDKPLTWRLPVIDCSVKPGGRCNSLIGAIQVDVLWMLNDTTNLSKLDEDAPWSMSRTGPNGQQVRWDARTNTCVNCAKVVPVTDPNNGLQRWSSFVAAFNLRNADGTPAAWRAKTIYYAPDCQPVEGPFGGTGGANFGIRAKVPVLVF
jgi:hypothetical protein